MTKQELIKKYQERLADANNALDLQNSLIKRLEGKMREDSQWYECIKFFIKNDISKLKEYISDLEQMG